MKLLWILYVIAGSPISQGEFNSAKECGVALETARTKSFGTTKADFLCVPYVSSEMEGRP